MKRLMLVLLVLVGTAGLLVAAGQDVDVVHLKDGNVLRGTVVERQTYPAEAVKFRTLDGLEMVIPMDKIDRITREAAGTAPGEAAGEPMGRYAFEVNLLGFLQFGPFARFHIQVGDELYLAPHVRVGYAGLLPWVLFDNPDIGAGASLLGFFPVGYAGNRVYAGGFVEGSLNMEGNFIVTGGANAGYRFRFENGRYWNVGAFAGAFYDTWYETAYFFGMLEVAWGKEF